MIIMLSVAPAALASDNGVEAAPPLALPRNPADGVKLGVGSAAVVVHLPADAASLTARVTARGEVVYGGSRASTIVHRDASGVQITTVSKPSSGQDRFVYRLKLQAGGRLKHHPDGSVTVLDGAGERLALIDAPWAKDSTGRSLPTSYRVDAMTLTQVVDTRAAVGAVIADPHIEIIGPSINPLHPRLAGVRVWFTRAETEKLYRYKHVASVAGALRIACGLIPNKLAKAACSVAVAVTIVDFATNLTQAHDRRRCLTMDVGIGPGPVLGTQLPDWQDRGGGQCRA